MASIKNKGKLDASKLAEILTNYFCKLEWLDRGQTGDEWRSQGFFWKKLGGIWKRSNLFSTRSWLFCTRMMRFAPWKSGIFYEKVVFFSLFCHFFTKKWSILGFRGCAVAVQNIFLEKYAILDLIIKRKNDKFCAWRTQDNAGAWKPFFDLLRFCDFRRFVCDRLAPPWLLGAPLRDEGGRGHPFRSLAIGINKGVEGVATKKASPPAIAVAMRFFWEMQEITCEDPTPW